MPVAMNADPSNFITEGLLQEPYVNEIMGVATLALIVLISILIFAWGFVGYLALEYLANKNTA